jgi:hypothetical protein
MSTGLISRPPEMLVDWWWGDQQDARVVGDDLWVSDYLFNVGTEFSQRYVLLIRSIWQRSIVGSKENNLNAR